MTWNNPAAEVKILSQMVVDGKVSIAEINALQNLYDEQGSLNPTSHEMFNALEEAERHNVPVLLHILYEDTAYDTSWASVCRYVSTYRLNGQFPWEEDRSYEDASVNDVIDDNVTDENIEEVIKSMDGEGMELMSELPAQVLSEYIPDDLPNEMYEEVKSKVSSKCVNVIRNQ